ncbi:hypothetical protein ACI2LF_17010 [Kribbella sp. NPDC020789]
MTTATIDEFDLDIRLGPLDTQSVPKAVTVRTTRPWSDGVCCSDSCCAD